MYADDKVLFAENRENLQEMMDALLQWTREYGLTVNRKDQSNDFQVLLAAWK